MEPGRFILHDGDHHHGRGLRGGPSTVTRRPDLKIVARAFEEPTIHKLYRAGADHVVSPNQSGAIRMASLFLRPSVVSFLDVATRSPDLSLRLEQQSLGERTKMAGKTLMEARIPQKTGLIVIAVRKKAAG